MNTVNLDVFRAFHQDWALLTAGRNDRFNAMTVSWGGIGCLWNKPVATVYVRPSRHTYEFMEQSAYFTVSFYPNEYRKELGTLGTLSGRDCDKIARVGFCPIPFGECVTFQEAETTLLCRKLYCQDMNADQIPAEIRERFYPEGETVHRIYIGEILEIQTKE